MVDRNVIARYYVQFDEEQKKGIQKLLRQTSNLWNCVIEHLGDYPDEYLSNPPSEEEDHRLECMIQMCYEVLVHKKDVGINFKVSPEWEERLKLIRELPNTVLRNRIDDLITGYQMAKRRKLSGSQNIALPTKKSRSSNQTVRFEPSDYMVTHNTVRILGKEPIEFEVKNFAQIDFSRPYSLTITNKRPGRMKDDYGPSPVEKSNYFITLFRINKETPI